MSTNHFKIYASSANANTYTDAEWGSVVPVNGASAGDLVSSKPLNTALRQSTLVTKALVDVITGNATNAPITDVGLNTSDTDLSGMIKTYFENMVVGIIPVNHASSSDIYGSGTKTNYGHVKLFTGNVKNVTYANGVACSPQHSHSQYLSKAYEAIEVEDTKLIFIDSYGFFEVSCELELCEGNGTSAAATKVVINDIIDLTDNYIGELHTKYVQTLGSSDGYVHTFYIGVRKNANNKLEANVYHTSHTTINNNNTIECPKNITNNVAYAPGKVGKMTWKWRHLDE